MRRLFCLAAALPLLLFLSSGSRVLLQTSTPAGRSTRAALPDTAAADSLQYVTQAGEVLIIDLPGEPGAENLVRYALLRAPALSWLVGDSFFWRTREKDAGLHELLFRATYSNAPPDTLSVQVDVTP